MKRMIAPLGLALAAVLAGCAQPPPPAGVAPAPGSPAATLNNVVRDGQLFCALETPLGPLVVALANVAGAPVKVTGQAADDVAAGCALIDAIPVAPPPNPAQAPLVASATALPPA